MGVVGGEGDPAPFGEFRGVLTIRAGTQPNDGTRPDHIIGAMQAEGGGGPEAGLGEQRLGDTEIGGNGSPGSGVVADPAADVGAAVNFGDDLDLRGLATVGGGEVSHHLVHGPHDFGPALLPVGGGLHGLQGLVGSAVDAQVERGESGRGRFSRSER